MARTHPLLELSRDRSAVIDEVISRTALAVDPKDIEAKLTEAVFWERKRLEKGSDPIRDTLDQSLWKDIGSQLIDLRTTEKNRDEVLNSLLKKVLRYHADEIAGNFSPWAYGLATAAVPRGLGWLLQALSWKSFQTLFSERVDLRRKIHLQGQAQQLQRLAKTGTIILAPTHFSNLDSLLIGWALYELRLPPFCYGAGLNLFTNPVFGYFMNNLGAYKVDRRKNHALYKQALKHYSTIILERGCHSLFFPGGGRSRSGGIERHLKLGLLGTAIDAYINNLLAQKPNPNIYVVPCVISYHFTLEANTLITDYIAEKGQSRFIIEDDESYNPKEVAQFLYKFFSASSSIYLNFGSALDPFGNLVDEHGQSLGPHGRTLDTTDFVKSFGQICHNTQRDQEYTRLLGDRLSIRYLQENIALTSHFIAYVYFEYLRKKFKSYDIFALLRLDESETCVSFLEFSDFALPLLQKLHRLYGEGRLFIEPALRSNELKNIFESASRNMGVYHSKRPLKIVQDNSGEKLFCENMKLLFYYHNRMEGYDLAGR